MKVSVESNSELKRTITITIPQADVDEAVNKRLEDAKRNARIDGFRPGKVPMHVIKSKYGKGVKAEALSEITQSNFYKAITEEKLTPASAPVITPNEENKDGFEFSASFEVYPEITVNPIEDLELEKPGAEVGEADIDAMVEKLRTQKANWKDFEGKSEDGHRVVISFEGNVNGKPIAEERIKDFPVVLGSKSMIPGFEDNLLGVSAGDELSFDAQFPEEYAEKDFAGQSGHFDAVVEKVEVSELPEVNEEFLKGFGVEDGDLKKFREDLLSNMKMELERALAAKRKQIVMDAIVDNNELALPEAMVDSEISQMVASLKENTQQVQQNEPDLPRELFEEQAKRRVKLGMLLSEVIQVNEIKADGEKVKKTIEDFAKTYKTPEDVINWYYSNPAELSKVENVVLEEQLVDWVYEKAKITDTTTTFEEIMSENKPAG